MTRGAKEKPNMYVRFVSQNWSQTSIWEVAVAAISLSFVKTVAFLTNKMENGDALIVLWSMGKGSRSPVSKFLL